MKFNHQEVSGRTISTNVATGHKRIMACELRDGDVIFNGMGDRYETVSAIVTDGTVAMIEFTYTQFGRNGSRTVECNKWTQFSLVHLAA